MERTRNYATIVYKESAPANWLEVLEETHIPAFVSPLHDVDVDGDGVVKKEHFHVMLMFESVKTRKQASEVFKLISGVGCEQINALRAYARYLCHLDSPDKPQYEPGRVQAFAGADYFGTIANASDKYEKIAEILDYCRIKKITSFARLVDHARHENFEWFKILCDYRNSAIREYIKSQYWTDKNFPGGVFKGKNIIEVTEWEEEDYDYEEF